MTPASSSRNRRLRAENPGSRQCHCPVGSDRHADGRHQIGKPAWPTVGASWKPPASKWIAATQRIRELEAALDEASMQVKEDQLTGAYNRRGLDEMFAREKDRSAQSGQPLSMVLLDVDNFKQLNDHYGHLTGDQVLKHLVDTISANLRPNDIVARLGGEEFVLLLPATPPPKTPPPTDRAPATPAHPRLFHGRPGPIALSSPSALASPCGSWAKTKWTPSNAPTRRCIAPNLAGKTAATFCLNASPILDTPAAPSRRLWTLNAGLCPAVKVNGA